MKLILCLTAFLFIATGGVHAAGSDDGHSHGHNAAPIGEPGKAKDAARSVEIVLYDNYYEPESITVKKGEAVRFVIKNRGRLVHEFNIGTAEMHAAHKDEMLMMVKHGVLFPDRIDHEKMEAGGEDGHSMKHDDPNSVLLEPGKEGEIVWKFSEAAILEFACNIPGHYEAGMVGEFQWQ
ncbi:MAG: cupredoxin family protein [Proteobacteria bacterium]|nr:cupredoxin family protein [Pseudomonadota bacterium]